MVSALQAFAIGGIVGIIGGVLIFTPSGRRLAGATAGAGTRQIGKASQRLSARLEASGR